MRPARAARWIAIIGIAFLTLSGRSQAEEESLEFKVKAAYLANFAQFVEWPEKSFSRADAPILIGVLGQDPFGENLERACADKNANGRPLKIRRVRTLADAAACQIVYVAASERARLKDILDELRKRPVLTVGESDDFVRNGGIVRFAVRDQRVQFDINEEAAKDAGLRISSKLLRLAAKVQEK